MPVQKSDQIMVHALVTQYCDRRLAEFADAPPAVRVNLTEKFRLSPSEVTPEQLAELQRQLPALLPPLYAAYLTCGAFPGVEWADYALPPTPVGKGLATVSRYMLDGSARSLWPCGYMQFASGPCGDPVCFDLGEPGQEGDYPVVVFNHDVIPRQDWGERQSLRPHAQQVAGSFREFLTFLCAGHTPAPQNE